jgi:outer membrane protein assembly factor BamD
MIAVLFGLCAVAGCKSAPPTFESPAPAEELYAEGIEKLEGRKILGVLPWVNHGDAIETFQAIIDNYPYSDYAVLAELKIADAYFEDQKYEEALSYYRDFSDLHPQHPKVPYTIWRSALCHERRKRPSNRDQTAVREAVVYLDRLLLSYPFSEHTAEAEEMWRSLRRQLARNIVGIGDFYMKRDEFESAAERYRMLLNEYPGLGFDAATLYKLGECYWAMNRKMEAERIFQSILQNYEGNAYASKAEERIEAGESDCGPIRGLAFWTQCER